MKRSAAIAIGILSAMLAGPQALAQGFIPYMQGPMMQGQGRPGPQGANRPPPQRDMRGQADAERGRMSADEREQLRRDIRDADRDIYHPAKQAPADPRRGGRR